MPDNLYANANEIQRRWTLQRWQVVLVFFLIHQTEEIFFSFYDWRARISLPGWAAFTDASFMYGFDAPWKAALLVLGQCSALLAAAYLLRKKSAAAKWVMTMLITVLLLAFLLHIALSLSTHSWMPGVYTSIPGLPIGAYLLYWIWHTPASTGL